MARYDAHDHETRHEQPAETPEPAEGVENRHGRGLPTRERDFLVPAKDAKGASIRVQCRMQPEALRLVADIHQSRKYPFRVQGDLIRWCIDTGVKLLAQGAGVPSVVAQAETIRQMLIDEEYQLQYAENFRTLKRVVERYLELGAPQKARELLIRTQRQIDSMPGDYWKSQYLQELDRRYSGLLDGELPGLGRVVIGGHTALLADDDGPPVGARPRPGRDDDGSVDQ